MLYKGTNVNDICIKKRQLPKPQIYFPWPMQHENIPNVSAYCPEGFGSTLTYINMKTVRLYVQTAINLQRKCLGTPGCKNMENIFINFIWLNVQAEYLIQTILYHFKWDMALWKWPKYSEPGDKQWQHSLWGWRNCALSGNAINVSIS